MTPEADLFTPIQLGACELPNRIVMAPLTRNRAGPGNVPTPMNAEYYAQRASAGLIISEATQISPQGVGYPATPGIHNAEQIAGWQQVTDAVHEQGGRIFMQLWHVGRISHPSLQPDDGLPVAPSAIKPAGEAVTYEGMKPFVTPRALTVEEIRDIVGQYAAAAENALAAGFDGVEIHAANGYLLDQFLRDGSNHRDDEYGGSVKNRLRFLQEVTAAVCAVVDSHRVGVRISPENGFNDMHDSDAQHTFTEVTQMLNTFRLAYLHVLEGDMQTGQTELDYQALRTEFDGPYMANSGYDYQRAQKAVANGQVDLVAFGRLFISNPDLPERFRIGAALATADEATFYGGDEAGYIDYPAMTEADLVSA